MYAAKLIQAFEAMNCLHGKESKGSVQAHSSIVLIIGIALLLTRKLTLE